VATCAENEKVIPQAASTGAQQFTVADALTLPTHNPSDRVDADPELQLLSVAFLDLW